MANEEKKSSIFGSAIIAAPMVAGAGITARNIASNWSSIKGPVVGAPVNQIQEVIRAFTKQYTRSPKMSGFRKDKIRLLEDLAESSTLTASQVREAAYRVSHHIDPTGAFTDVLNRRLGPAATGGQALSDLAKILSEGGNIYTGRAVESLADDLTLLSERVGAGLSIDPKGLKAKIPRYSKTFQPHEYPQWLTSEIEKIQKHYIIPFAVIFYQ